MYVLMIDDHLMFLQGLRILLGELKPELRIDASTDVGQAVQLVALGRHDLVLLDWHLAGCDGEEAIRRLRDAGCSARIVVLSGETHAELILHTVEVGAAGFIPKSYSSEMMVTALDRVLAGQIYLPAEVRQLAPPASSAGSAVLAGLLAQLTQRQFDVYRAAARGLPNKLIARELGITESTVKTHLTAVFGLLGVRNRTEAAYHASRHGIDVSRGG